MVNSTAMRLQANVVVVRQPIPLNDASVPMSVTGLNSSLDVFVIFVTTVGLEAGL